MLLNDALLRSSVRCKAIVAASVDRLQKEAKSVQEI